MGTSSITSDGRKILINQFKKSLDGDSDTYYLGLSGADSSTAGLHDQMLARNEMHFVKTISANSFVVETYDWISGTVYNQYDNNDTNRTQFYLSNGKNEVFICLQTGKTSTGIATGSSVEPSSTLALAYDGLSRTFPTGDGYLWRYLYKMSGSSVNNFKTSEYMPVQKIVGSGVIAETIEQSNLQTTAIAGEILGVAIVDGGSNYQFNPRIDLEGNGTGGTFVGTISDGKIVKIVADSDNFGRILHGSGYDYAKVFPSAGNAILRPIIAPNGGINKDPVASLCAGKIMLQNTVQNNEGNVVPLADPANDFKQVALLRNLELADSAKTLFTAQIGTAMHSFTVSGGSGIFVADEIFETPTQTKGKTFWHDNSNNRLYYVQNDSTGYGEFAVSETITSTATSTAKVVDAIIQPDFNRYSGDLLYINNLKDGIIRTGTQTEDFRIVIDLGTE
jgi:hypothetical protein